MTSDRGCEYRVYSTGPRTDPWGTPKTRGAGVDIKPSTTPDCVLSLRCDSNQDSAIPEIQKVLSSRLNRMAWSRVSKAALRSNSASIDTSFWSDFVRRPSSTLKTAVSVLWYFVYLKYSLINFQNALIGMSIAIQVAKSCKQDYFMLLRYCTSPSLSLSVIPLGKNSGLLF